MGASFLDIYHLAQERDPVYAAARETLNAQHTLIAQSRAALLPNLNAQAGYTYQNIHNDFKGEAKQANQNKENPLRDWKQNDYGSANYAVQVQQALFDAEAMPMYREAKRAYKQAEIQYDYAKQDLMTRVTQAYLSVLTAEEQLQATIAERRALEEQQAQAQKEFEVGTAAITDAQDAQARRDLAVAQELQYRNDLAVSKRELSRIIGQAVPPLLGLGDKLQLAPPDPGDVQAWVNRALQSNLTVLAQREGMQVAQLELRARQGARLPTLNLVAGRQWFEDRSPTFDASWYDRTTDSAGLQLQIPIFQGGYLIARAREAAARLNESKENLLDASRGAELAASQAYLNLVTTIAQVQAFEQALKSSQVSLESNQVGREVGTRTQVDVLDALRQVYAARRDLYRSRYTYLQDQVMLKAAVGELKDADLEAMATQLTVTPEQRGVTGDGEENIEYPRNMNQPLPTIEAPRPNETLHPTGRVAPDLGLGHKPALSGEGSREP
jgi:outer membrane protein